MVLKAVGKYIETLGISTLLTHGEKNADIIYFQLDKIYDTIDLSSCEFVLRVQNSKDIKIDITLEKYLTDEYIMLKFIVDETITAVNGELKLELRALKDNSLKVKYRMNSIYVVSSLTDELDDTDVFTKQQKENNFPLVDTVTPYSNLNISSTFGTYEKTEV